LSQAEATAPTASIYYGLAGTAIALLHMASVRKDPLLLAHATLWAERCGAVARRRTAYLSPRLELTSDMLGRVSPYHTRSGLDYLHAAMADAQGDFVTRDRALSRWLRVLRLRSREIELTLGWAGVLLVAGLALELVGEESPAMRDHLLEAGRQVQGRVSNALHRGRSSGQHQNLGMAHGTAGVLYAALRWELVSGTPRPDWVETALSRVARKAQISATGARWPWFTLDSRGQAATSYMPGWCNGSAGLIWLWTLAHRVTGDEAYGRLAELAAQDAWNNDPGEIHFCCGLVGIAYGLLNLYRHTGDQVWLTRAEALAERAAGRALDARHAGSSEFAHSLFRGDPGLAVLLVDLEHPSRAAFPLVDAGR
jgi:serine/threonine-protein kinase